MAISRTQKEKTIQELADKLSQAKSVVLTNFVNLSVKDDQALRADLREAEVNYKVVKKTLLVRVLAKAELENFELKDVTGNIGLGLADDEINAAKVLYKFAQDNISYKILAGFMDRELMSEQKIMELAKLPGKEELVAKTLATIKAPITGFVNALAGNMRNLIGVLNALREVKN